MRWVIRLLRPMLFLLGVVLIVQPLLLWNATGRATFTRYVNEARAAAEAQSAQSDVASLFDNTGVNDGFETIELEPNRFALGLLPSTYPHRIWDRDLVSVLTIAGPGAIVLFVSILPLRIGRGGQKSGGPDASHKGDAPSMKETES